MERPIDIVEQAIYIEPNVFNNDSEYELFHSYLESQKYIEWLEAELKKLRVADVSKRKFAVEWMRNVNYGIGSGTEYFDAETREDALKQFWNGKNKEAFEVNTIYVC
jgi:hypothetical protein